MSGTPAAAAGVRARSPRAAIAALLVLVASGHTAPVVEGGLGEQGARSDPFDCNVGLGHADDEWTVAKKLWCCSEKKLGCEETKALPGAGELRYDCKYGLDQWQQIWSEAKKDWCCQHGQAGCNDAASTTVLAPHAGPAVASVRADTPNPEPFDDFGNAGKHRPRPSMSFDGEWVDKRGDHVRVDGRDISWPGTDRRATVTSFDPTSFTMRYGGGDYHARYSGGRLAWDVDDVWQRVKGAKPEAHATAVAPGASAPASVGAGPAVTAKTRAGDAMVKVDSVMGSLDTDMNGHLDFVEINHLQEAAGLKSIPRKTYEQLCSDFEEDPEVGLGVHTLMSIYAKSGALEASEKFLSGQRDLAGERWSLSPFLLASGFFLASFVVAAAALRGRTWPLRRHPYISDSVLGPVAAEYLAVVGGEGSGESAPPDSGMA